MPARPRAGRRSVLPSVYSRRHGRRQDSAGHTQRLTLYTARWSTGSEASRGAGLSASVDWLFVRLA